MFNKRMLAIVAVTLLAVPAMGAAAPIVVPPVTERLVEGHTVFTVIETYRSSQTYTLNVHFAAAAAVLVREYQAQAVATYSRFPGVLWFNDQYLVEPTAASDANANAAYRYPCGGAVIAVNQGDADPRLVAVSDPQAAPANADLLSGADYGNDQAWLNVNDLPNDAHSDTVVPATVDTTTGAATMNYVESYLITDPNDHTWVIDKYQQYSRVSLTNPTPTPEFVGNVWVVNILGHPGFVPDDGNANCPAFRDYLDVPVVGATAQGAYDTGYGQVRDAKCGVSVPAPIGGFDSNDVTVGNEPNVGPADDSPCAGYNNPSATGYCYDGNAGTTAAFCATQPDRLYNAVLYFKLEDLTKADVDMTDGDAVATTTNGCQVGTEWTCPGWDGTPYSATGDDNAEGNSHPFNPNVGAPGTTNTEMDCPPGFTGLGTPVNHGGSGAADALQCSHNHATRLVDIYFDGAARPFEPVVRTFAIKDLEGSSAPFCGTDGSNGQTAGQAC